MERTKIMPKNSATKLTNEDYKNIRKFFNDGMQLQTILNSYRIGYQRLNRIVNNPNYLAGGNRPMMGPTGPKGGHGGQGGQGSDSIIGNPTVGSELARVKNEEEFFKARLRKLKK